MNKVKWSFIKGAWKNLRKKIKSSYNLFFNSLQLQIPDLPEGIYEVDGGDSFAITVGFSPANVNLVWKIMIDAGWTTARAADEIIAKMKKTSMEFTWWRHNNSKGVISIWVSVGGKGSNCERVVIGTETIEKDIYETICTEGAAEGALAGLETATWPEW